MLFQIDSCLKAVTVDKFPLRQNFRELDICFTVNVFDQSLSPLSNIWRVQQCSCTDETLRILMVMLLPTAAKKCKAITGERVESVELEALLTFMYDSVEVWPSKYWPQREPYGSVAVSPWCWSLGHSNALVQHWREQLAAASDHNRHFCVLEYLNSTYRSCLGSPTNCLI